MNVLRSVPVLTRPKAALFMVGAIACFHLAYWPESFGLCPLAIIGYVICLVQLARLETTRRSFYAGMATGLFCIAPQLVCFWKIFGPAALALWAILALWLGAFTGITHAGLKQFGPRWIALRVPFIWVGLEYFRSEVYYLKFSWLNIGYAFSDWQVFPFHFFGMYGVGFIAALCAGLFLVIPWLYATAATVALTLLLALTTLISSPALTPAQIRIAGVQMEFPGEQDIPRALDSLLAKYPDADLFVLSEYTLDGPVPESLKDWCRAHHHYLVVGGKDPAPKDNFYDSAFVVGPDGTVIFRQVKSVPIQFFKDGLPAPEQEVWKSPWGKIGFCVCYDLSYTRVIDGLVNKGAQLIVVPTMDVIDWGERQHQLHARVAPVRAAEYRLPIFRLASSGISQAVAPDGSVLATAPYGGEGQSLYATFNLPKKGSLPVDRYFAPFFSLATSIWIILLCILRRKSSSTPATVAQSPPLADIAHSAEK